MKNVLRIISVFIIGITFACNAGAQTRVTMHKGPELKSFQDYIDSEPNFKPTSLTFEEEYEQFTLLLNTPEGDIFNTSKKFYFNKWGTLWLTVITEGYGGSSAKYGAASKYSYIKMFDDDEYYTRMEYELTEDQKAKGFVEMIVWTTPSGEGEGSVSLRTDENGWIMEVKEYVDHWWWDDPRDIELNYIKD